MSGAMEATSVAGFDRRVSAAEERRVIIASSVGTVFEWYDFYLYAILAPFFAGLFFPPGNYTFQLLGAFGAYAAGFLVRPFGALIFGRIGDLVGRKYTFLITITVMGLATVLVGFLPTYVTIGAAAPIILLLLRLAQGLALGGEYGGAATYVAEHAPDERRGRATSWIQTTATVGMLAALVVIGLVRLSQSATTFSNWGWRIAFWFSIPLLIISIYIRLKLNESPLFQRMKSQGKGSRSPLKDSFLKYPNNKYVALALLGATAGQGVVWYTGQFYALFFIQIYLKLDFIPTYALIGLSLVLATPFFIVFGALSDRIGRKKIILAGCLIAAVTYFPLFKGLTHFINPGLERFQDTVPISVSADPKECNFHIFVGPWTNQSACDRARSYLTSSGLNFQQLAPVPGQSVVIKIGNTELRGWDPTTSPAQAKAALTAAGYPAKADTSQVNWVMAEVLLVIMVIYVTMVYGPIAAFLVELFPTRIRYTSMSLPYHIGNGWFGGMLPLLATAIVANSGSIYAGLWYPIIVSLMTLVIGGAFLHETRHLRLDDEAPIATAAAAGARV
jgi:MFS family permease